MHWVISQETNDPEHNLRCDSGGGLPGRGGFVTDHEKCQRETKSKSVLYYTSTPFVYF